MRRNSLFLILWCVVSAPFRRHNKMAAQRSDLLSVHPEVRTVDESSVVSHSRVADVSRSLLLLVATDKGARQPAVLLLDV